MTEAVAEAFTRPFSDAQADASAAVQAVEQLATEINIADAALVLVRERIARRRKYVEGSDDVQFPAPGPDGKVKSNEQTRASTIQMLLDDDAEFEAWRDEERSLDAKRRDAMVAIETWRELRSIAKRRMEFVIAMAGADA